MTYLFLIRLLCTAVVLCIIVSVVYIHFVNKNAEQKISIHTNIYNMTKFQENYYKNYNALIKGYPIIHKYVNETINAINKILVNGDIYYKSVEIKRSTKNELNIDALIRELTKAEKNEKEIFELVLQRNSIINNIFKVKHPVKYKIETIKKIIAIKILDVLIFICKRMLVVGELSKSSKLMLGSFENKKGEINEGIVMEA